MRVELAVMEAIRPAPSRAVQRSWPAILALLLIGLLIAGAALPPAPPGGLSLLPRIGAGGVARDEGAAAPASAGASAVTDTPGAATLPAFDPAAAPAPAGGPAPAGARIAGLLGLASRPGGDAGAPYIPDVLIPEYEWLASCQTESGAFTLAPGHASIVPYFGNYAAMVLLRWDAGAAKRHLEWYLAHLNARDRHGLGGTVYDYTVHGGQEESTRSYDSADSYAATFLAAVARYFFATGDADFVVGNMGRITTVAGVCLELQDPVDGLVWAKADRRHKFLMDNSEVQLGLDLWAETLRTLGYWSESRPYAAAAARIRAAVESELWLPAANAYAWGRTSAGARTERRRWYPDAVCQIYPALFGVIDPQSTRAQDLLRRVNRKYPGWPLLDRGDSFPWALAAYGALMCGDEARAMQYVETVWSRYISEGRPWPWYILESAFYIQIVSELAQPGSSAPVRR